jgi:hypothetical protein
VYCSLTISMPRAAADFLNTAATPWPSAIRSSMTATRFDLSASDA